MTDTFAGYSAGIDSPATQAAAVTPNDAADLAVAGRALCVGTAGNLAVVTVGGSKATLVGISGWVPIRVARVLATGTTAADIVVLW